MTAVLIAMVTLAWGDDLWDRVKTRLSSIPGDFTTHQLSRTHNQTFLLETFVSMEGNLKLAIKMLSELENYPKWVLKNINRKASGGEYYVKVIDIKPDPVKKRLTIHFGISVGKFKYTSERTFQMTETRLPDRFVFEGKAVADDSSLVDSASGTMTVFQAPGVRDRLWIYIRGQVRVKSNLLYTLLPERPAQAEAGARLKTAIENYLDWEISGQAEEKSGSGPAAKSDGIKAPQKER